MKSGGSFLTLLHRLAVGEDLKKNNKVEILSCKDTVNIRYITS